MLDVHKQDSQDARKKLLSSYTLLVFASVQIATAAEKVAKQIQKSKISTPDVEALLLQLELEIEHLGLITCDKIQSKKHLMPWTTTQ